MRKRLGVFLFVFHMAIIAVGAWLAFWCKIYTMQMETFSEKWFEKSKTLKRAMNKFSGGEVVIVGGSSLFHGAPIMALKACSRIVSMVYFSSPKDDQGAVDKIKSEVQAFVWVPEGDLDGYISKSEAVLIGPGMMRSHVREHGFVCDDEGKVTRDLTIGLFKKFPNKKWIVDGGALQVVAASEIPKGAIVTPNSREFEMVFGEKLLTLVTERVEQVQLIAKKYGIVILIKDETSLVCNGEEAIAIEGGNDGMIKGGVGDVTAGVILGFLAKDEPIVACSIASHLVKLAGRKLLEERDMMFNAQDLCETIPIVYGQVLKRI